MKRFMLVSILVALVAACAGPVADGNTVTGSGQLVSRSFDLAGFSRLDANDTAQVEVTHGEAFRVDVEVDDNLASRLDVAVRGNALHIGLQNGSYRHVTLRAQVTMPELTGITLNGASTLHGELAGEDLTLDLNGASRATLTGTAGRVSIVINGGSQALLGNLAARDVELDANGGSQVEVQTSGAVRGKANGASTITVAGSPTSVDVETEGASRVITK
jgi:predicted small secreted protein